MAKNIKTNKISSIVEESEPLSKALQQFIHKIEGLKVLYPDIVEVYSKRAYRTSKNLANFLETRKKVVKGKRLDFQIKVDDFFHFSQIMDSFQREMISIETLSQGFIISLVSQYDAFLGDLLKWIYSKKPEILNSSDKQISYPQLIQFKTFDEAKEYLIEKEVENFLRESHSAQIKILEKLLNIPLTKGLDIWPDFIELTERRNLYVHTNGIVSRQYLSICKSNNVKLEGVEIGKQLASTPDYFENAYHILFEMAFKLSQVIRRKLLPEQISEADDNAINTSFNLLLKEEYDLVIKLLSFACNDLKKHSEEKARITMVVNYAIAYKWKGEKQKTNEILDKEDWSVCSDEYQMAYLTLKEKYKDAAELMTQMGKKAKIGKTDYLIWPLFKYFRKSRYFRKAFKKVFNQDYVTIKRTTEYKNLTNLFKV